jgi:hypothetical protein
MVLGRRDTSQCLQKQDFFKKQKKKLQYLRTKVSMMESKRVSIQPWKQIIANDLISKLRNNNKIQITQIIY